MEVFFVLFPLSFALALLGLGAFIVSVRRGQFQDLDTQASRMVWDAEEKIQGNGQEGATCRTEAGE